MVTRGGFHVGNGINWKGQIFSKMRNYTTTNRMTVCSIPNLIPLFCLFLCKRDTSCGVYFFSVVLAVIGNDSTLIIRSVYTTIWLPKLAISCILHGKENACGSA